MKRYATFIFIALTLILSGAASAQSVNQMKAQLNRSTSKSEQMELSYKIAKSLYDAKQSPAEVTKYADQARTLAGALEAKRRLVEATLLSADGLLRQGKSREAAVRYTDTWNAARNYGQYELALDATERLKDIAKKDKNLPEALKWSEETVNYLRGNTGRSTSSGDALRRLETQLENALAENRSLKDQIAQISGQSQTLTTTYEQQLQEVQTKTQEEITKREVTISQISQAKQKSDSLFNMRTRELSREQALSELRKVELERANEEQERIKAQAAVEKQRSDYIRNFLALGAGFILILATLFYLRYRAKRRTANELAAKNKVIEEEQKKSDSLLLNILPPAIAQELKANNKVAARKYDQATVMFVDFTGFTRLSEVLSPEDLVAELDYCFTSFDRIISKYKIEKIKTVGDAYICASGLSDKNASPSDMVKAALEIQDFLQHLKAQHMNQGLPYFEARVGIHTGPVVAGVVGEKKFAYDIWGDTVNIAARMEETCEPGRVNVSEDSYLLTKYEFEWHTRGKVAAKNKGMMDMYYVTGIKTY